MVGLDNPVHLLILLALLLLVFGAKRLPEMGRSLGSGLRGFKESLTGEQRPAGADELAAGADGHGAVEESEQPAGAERASVV